jgi:hypothetical protein
MEVSPEINRIYFKPDLLKTYNINRREKLKDPNKAGQIN